MARSDRRVCLASPVLLVPRVQLAQRERTELTAPSDRKVRRDPSALPVLPDLAAPPALPDRTT